MQSAAAMLAAGMCEWLLMIGELDRRESWASWECRSMAHWLAWKCAVSLRTAREHVRVARELERLPLVCAEFAKGRLSYSKVRALARMVLDPESEAELVELGLVATASQLDVIASGVQQVRRLNDPEREARVHEGRRLDLIVEEDGTGKVTMRGPADLIAEFMVAIDAVMAEEGAANDGDGRAARRFDAALTIARRSTAPRAQAPVEDAPVEEPPLAATIVIRTEAQGPLTADDVRAMAERAGPAIAYGLPISRSAYERLRCDAMLAVERALEDGSVERTPMLDPIPRRLRRAVRARDLGRCRWPGCGSRASLHVHHIVWRIRAGENSTSNLLCLCHHHHNAIHLRGWRIVGDADGTLQFIDPNGRVADEHTGRARPVRAGTLARAIAARGVHTEPIASGLGDRMNRTWAVNVLCHNEEIRQRRN